jgi:hypothetical protein
VGLMVTSGLSTFDVGVVSGQPLVSMVVTHRCCATERRAGSMKT